MKLDYEALFVIISVFVRSAKGLSDSGQNEQSAGVSTFGAELGAGGMLALTVLGIFGGILLLIICFASWSMILTCCELRNTKRRGDSFREQIHLGERTVLTSRIYRRPLEKETHVDSIESIV